MYRTYLPAYRRTRSVTFSSGSKRGEDVPDLKAHYFYSSPLHVDDPLSPVPPASGSDSKSTKHPPRPFSEHDNNALEEAWLALRSEKDRKHHNKGKLPNAGWGFHNESRSSSSIVGTPAQKQRKIVPDEAAALRPMAHSAVDGDGNLCQCHGGHDARKSQPGHCHCVSGPNASNIAQSPYANPQDSKKTKESKHSGSKKPKEPNSSSGTGNNEAAHADPIKQLAADRDAYLEVEAQGNSNNIICDDAHHVPLEPKVPACCSAFERNAEAGSKRTHYIDGNASSDSISDEEQPLTTIESKKHEQGKDSLTWKVLRPSPADHEGDIAQGDATDEKSSPSKTPLSSKERGSSQFLATEPDVSMSGSKSHIAFEKNGKSKDHRDFENLLGHSRSGYLHDAQTTEPTGKERKSPEKATQPSDLTHIPPQSGEAGTSGRPFLKLPSRENSPPPLSVELYPLEGENQKLMDDLPDNLPRSSPKSYKRGSTETEVLHDHKCRAQKNTKAHADVSVGISRLHKVSLPALQMKPIYWLPVHDVAPVIRGTWFYRTTMYPVEPAVANQLEMGYRELRPWSQTWKDELNSAMEVGAAGEEKIAHRLWPQDEKTTTHNILSTHPYCAARCFNGEAAAEGTIDPENSEGKGSDTQTASKKYPTCQVIYKDSRNAFVLKPSLQPSSYHGRKPLQKIKKGTTVGIHVVRGFDWKAWEKLHPSKRSTMAFKVEENIAISGDLDVGTGNACTASRSQEEQKKVTDLVLVIHGIGQKLSERVESFHFTHAINGFRRSINAELCNEAVRSVLRDDLGGVMVLPVNWRSSISFDDGGPIKNGQDDSSNSSFSLKDITPATIPAVRNLISDVMLDIPYYMSNNKARMIQAVISEANRVYRLWCKNNPEFPKEGRVHIIAHSLGSAMAAEILSKQPTLVPKVDLHGKKINSKHFDFKTTNLFFVGSPAGFFLLLERSKLIPRRGLHKPGAEPGENNDRSLVGDAGMFGCLAVDNIYNVMHYNDPIAYRLNATVDPQYAASLKNAQVPSASAGFFESIGNAMKSMTPGVSAPADLAVGQMAKPTLIARLPSQLEMEVHDFTAEEKAEKKFLMLNDNGQVDWFLSTSSGPLEIQYLTMLSAHSSYWTSPDFVRMVVTELGRSPGRSHALPNMKATKIRHKS